ncbi:MAG: hypothetical protein U5L08_06350 [Xanthomonadales bacterium]|nr:hypothetical protein [Xanthomonadales bacterium]
MRGWAAGRRPTIGLFKAGREQAAAEGRFVHVFVQRGDMSTAVQIPERIRAALEALRVE